MQYMPSLILPQFRRNSLTFLLASLALLFLSSCSPKQAEFYSRGNDTPPDSNLDLQGLIDSAPDGGTVHIPMGRYVLSDGLIVSGRKDLTIECAPGSQILVNDISADVLEIADCTNITLRGAFLRHLKPLPNYECHGDVLKIRKAENVRVENSELDGCGAIGVSAWGSNNITISHCLIQHNSFNALYFDRCDVIRVKNCVIQDNANFMQMYGSTDVEMSGNVAQRNGGYWDEPEKPGLQE